MCTAEDSPTTVPPPAEQQEPSFAEQVGNQIDDFIRNFFYSVGKFVAFRPWTTIFGSIFIAVCCGAGNLRFTTENRPDELWVPQGTTAKVEEQQFLEYYPPSTRINTMIISSSTSTSASTTSSTRNVLTQEALEQALELQMEIATTESNYEDTDNNTNKTYTLTDLCTQAGGSCVSSYSGVCQCLISGILRMWNYDVETFKSDTDFMATLNQYGTKEDLDAVLGNAVFDENDVLISAEAFTVTYFLDDRTIVDGGTETDPINEQWELDAFLTPIQQEPTPYTKLDIDYFSSRSFSDEFGDAIGGDLILVNVSYVVIFLFLGATLGKIRCGPGSRWSMSLAALIMIGLSTAAGFGISSAVGLFFGPVHSLLPFILLGIGVDDCFVIVNAFDRERSMPRKQEEDETLVDRCARGLARAGASITVTSLTDLVAFAISSSSALPALASFCAYASICITFLWFFASTFFTACLVLDERRQRRNARDCLCCLTRGGSSEEGAEATEADLNDNEEGLVSRYFRNYHAPAILSKAGKAIVLVLFAGLLGFGIFGALNLSVENTELEFIPEGSYLLDYTDAAEEWFPDDGIAFFVIFEETQANLGNGIYDKRQELAELDERLAGKSTAPPYIAEPVSEDAYRNVMTGLEEYLMSSGTDAIGGAEVGSDGWPSTYEGFVLTLDKFTDVGAPGFAYAQDVSMVTDVATNTSRLEAIRVESEYVRLTKDKRGETIADADKQIDAMEATREMVDSWTDLPPSFPYSQIFLTVEGFKIIQQELFTNVGLAIMSVAIIVLVTVASFMTALLITLNVAFCIIEILGFMWAAGIAIDSVSVINIVLAVGLSVDYSAHVGHAFMVKGGTDWDRRVTETLADIGAAVLCGATSTALAVAVLLGSSSYVFEILSTQFALTVALGVSHGLILLPVMLSLFGPKPFAAAENLDGQEENVDATKKPTEDDEASEEQMENVAVPQPAPENNFALEVDGAPSMDV